MVGQNKNELFFITMLKMLKKYYVIGTCKKCVGHIR